MSMTTSIARTFVAASSAVLLLASAGLVDAKPNRGGGGGGGGGAHAGARGGGGGHEARPQVNNTKADSRSRDVRNTSVNNVSSNRNVNVNSSKNVNVNVDHGGCCGWDNDYHPVATAAAVTATVAVTSAVIGSMVNTVPAGCMPVNYGGMVYQQCGNTWYMPQGPQYVVVNPPY